MIAPFPAGGGVDIVARIIGQRLAEKWGQQVVVDNRTGASGIIGTEIAAGAAPDGHTLIMGNVATHAVNITLFKRLPYDPVRDFAPVTLVAVVPEMLALHPAVPANSVKELIALAKAKPGQLTFGSSGRGTPPHLAAELFKTLAGVDLVHVPYKGSAPALADLMGGQITMYFGNILSVVPLVKSGRLKALGVTSSRRSRVAPDVPAIAEAGLPAFEDYNWYGVLTRVNTSRPIIDKLNQAIVQILRTPDVAQRLEQQGADVIGNTPEEFAKFIRSEIDKYARVVKASGLRAE